MSGHNDGTPKTISGTCTATIGGDNDFKSFEGLRYVLNLDESRNRWSISAISGADSDKFHQEFWFWIPNDGDVVNLVYEITQEHGDATKANATWAKANSSSYTLYPATHGELTITLNRASKTLEVTFAFEGKNGLDNKVTVTQGDMKLRDFETHNKNKVAGAVTCDLSGDLTARYQSTATQLSKQDGSAGFPDYISGWSQHFASKPNPADYRIALNIGKDVSPGTYAFSPRAKKSVYFSTICLEAISTSAKAVKSHLIQSPTTRH